MKFANRAKKIMNVAVVNEESNRDSLLVLYEKELNKLKQELELKNQMLNNYMISESVFLIYKLARFCCSKGQYNK